ncbi:putative Ig domain-containing protein [Mucilaginibacter sp. HMF5004]|uniref:putative Ig domain-containing protein n=1 Tax=Mucilaginibacter rivuli TaxID=2857527 RepID=UPI001C5D5647|nr:putative Ig domain-containing protein [Mucilaginibacter rivuli]MBW4889232.1 putative Ig domain-containing protein [Mucilaginibacter rivuli]
MNFKTFNLIPCVLLLSVLTLKAQDVATPAPIDNTSFILTPKAGPQPHINGAKVFGVRPGRPIVYTVVATGIKPVKFSADNLPKGVKLDENTGILSGSISKAGTYTIVMHAKNQAGTDKRNFKLVVGEEVSLTPPMGWNSWNIYATKVTQDLLLANARAMVSSGLKDHGWSYMNIDDVWQGDRGGPLHAIQPNTVTFPDIKKASDEIHAMGLKIGIYSTPWVESYGHHVGGSANNPEGTFEAVKENVPRNKKMMPYAIGKYDFTDQDVKQWLAWNIDYLKYDWSPNELPETKKMFDALHNSGRDIILSLSNSTPFASIAELSAVSNAWRTGGDIRDNWKSLKPRLFSQDKWEPYAKPGHWNDPDMMVVGVVGWGKNYHPSLLTADEQYTHVSAWCLMSVPLLLGNDLTKLDEFTISLLSNDEVLALNQDPLGKQATVISRQGEAGVMAKGLEDGSIAVGLFNPGDTGKQEVVLNWADLKIQGKYIVRDLWRQKDLGTFEGNFKADVNQHGVVLISLRKAK